MNSSRYTSGRNELIKALLIKHEETLEKLPDAIKEKIGLAGGLLQLGEGKSTERLPIGNRSVDFVAEIFRLPKRK